MVDHGPRDVVYALAYGTDGRGPGAVSTLSDALLRQLRLDARPRGKLDPAEVVQQVFARAVPALDDLANDDEALLAAWLRRILARTLADARHTFTAAPRMSVRDTVAKG